MKAWWFVALFLISFILGLAYFIDDAGSGVEKALAKMEAEDQEWEQRGRAFARGMLWELMYGEVKLEDLSNELEWAESMRTLKKTIGDPKSPSSQGGER